MSRTAAALGRLRQANRWRLEHPAETLLVSSVPSVAGFPARWMPLGAVLLVDAVALVMVAVAWQLTRAIRPRRCPMCHPCRRRP